MSAANWRKANPATFQDDIRAVRERSIRAGDRQNIVARRCVGFEVATLNVVVPAPVTDGGPKLAVAPGGKLLTLKSTSSAKPLTAVMVAVKLAAFPATTVGHQGACGGNSKIGDSQPDGRSCSSYPASADAENGQRVISRRRVQGRADAQGCFTGADQRGRQEAGGCVWRQAADAKRTRVGNPRRVVNGDGIIDAHAGGHRLRRRYRGKREVAKTFRKIWACSAASFHRRQRWWSG